LNKEDEYVDEEKYTTVTVEEVEIGRSGFVEDESEESEKDYGSSNRVKKKENIPPVIKDEGKVDFKEKARPKAPRNKAKKARYGSKEERNEARMQERSKRKDKGGSKGGTKGKKRKKSGI